MSDRAVLHAQEGTSAFLGEGLLVCNAVSDNGQLFLISSRISASVFLFEC